MDVRISRRLLPLILASVIVLPACQGQGPKQSVGSKFGSGKGKLLGTAIGVLAGAWMGGEIGKSLDAEDRAAMQRTSQRAMEKAKTGSRTKWSNPDSGNRGSITPTKTYKTASGQYCREYQQTVTVGGRTQEAYGTACRRPDGTWRIANCPLKVIV